MYTATEFKKDVDTAVERFMDGLYTSDDVVLAVHQASQQFKTSEGEAASVEKK